MVVRGGVGRRSAWPAGTRPSPSARTHTPPRCCEFLPGAPTTTRGPRDRHRPAEGGRSRRRRRRSARPAATRPSPTARTHTPPPCSEFLTGAPTTAVDPEIATELPKMSSAAASAGGQLGLLEGTTRSQRGDAERPAHRRPQARRRLREAQPRAPPDRRQTNTVKRAQRRPRDLRRDPRNRKRHRHRHREPSPTDPQTRRTQGTTDSHNIPRGALNLSCKRADRKRQQRSRSLTEREPAYRSAREPVNNATATVGCKHEPPSGRALTHEQSGLT